MYARIQQRNSQIKEQTMPPLFHAKIKVSIKRRKQQHRDTKSKRASNAVRGAGPVHNTVRIEVMSVCWRDIYLYFETKG